MTTFSLFYLSKNELGYVKYVLKKLSWYRENGYKPILPAGINNRSSESEILKAIKNEFGVTAKAYKELKQKVKTELRRKTAKLDAFINLLDYPIPHKILVFFTKYGPGGSYAPPDKITVRFNKNSSVKRITQTIVHEILHLIIEKPVIQRYKIPHWDKENLVNSFFEHPKLKIIFPDYKFPSRYSFPRDKINLIKFK